MSTEKQTNYEEVVLDQSKPVEVKSQDYILMNSIVKETQQLGTKIYREVVFSWYEKNTHAKLSKKALAKIDKLELHKRYYRNIDIDLTDDNIKYFMTDLAFQAIKSDAASRGTFRDNVDKGNSKPRNPLPTTSTNGED